jgi:hypothetical protein
MEIQINGRNWNMKNFHKNIPNLPNK